MIQKYESWTFDTNTCPLSLHVKHRLPRHSSNQPMRPRAYRPLASLIEHEEPDAERDGEKPVFDRDGRRADGLLDRGDVADCWVIVCQ